MGGNKIGETERTLLAQYSPQIVQSALLPDSQAFARLSQQLVQSRSTSSIPFPGCPTARDLDILTAPDKSPFLSSADRAALLNLRADLFRVCKRAKERQVKVLIDAEYRFANFCLSQTPN